MSRFFFPATNGASYDEDNDYGAYNDYYYQGYSIHITGSGGNTKSLVTFNSSTIRSQLSGLVISACALTFDVEHFGESGPSATIVVGTHNYTYVPSYWNWSRTNTDRLERPSTGRGVVTEFPLGTIIGNEFANGVSTGITFGPGNSYSEYWHAGIITAGYATAPVLVIDASPANSAPYAPTLSSPADSAVVDLNHNATGFKWTHSDPNGDAQAAWHFKRTKTSNGAIDYWNGTAFVSTDTRLTQATAPITNGLMTIPAGIWGNGQRYTWTVATEDPAGLVGPYATARTVYASSPPSVVVTAPSTSPAIARPTITWTYSDTDGEGQFGWAAQVVAYEVYSQPGYNPDNYLGQAWSGSGTGTASAVQVSADLINHKKYRAYVKVSSSPNPSGGLQFSAWSFIEFTVVIPPYSPIITYPQNGSNADLAAGFTFTWSDAYFGNVGSQTGFAIRRNVSGGAYQWWSGATWVSTETFLAGTPSSYAFRTSEIVNGVTYTFAVAIRDDFNQVSPYSTGVTVVGTTTATVTVLSPLGVATINNPTVTWTEFSQENYPQQSWQVRIIQQAVYNVGGAFDPGAGFAVWDSTEVSDATTRNVVVPVNLLNANTYRAYVRVKTAGLYSGWAYSEFSISLIPPATPSAYTMVVDDAGAIDVYIQGRDSMLSEDASRNATGWQAATNCTLANSILNSSAQSGLMSTVTSSATGTMTARTSAAAIVAPGQTYTAAASLIASTTATPVNAYVSIEFLDALSSVVAVSSAGVQLDDSAIRSIAQGVAPDQAVSARVRITYQSVAATGQKHQFFDPVLRPGTGGEWSPGGNLGLTNVSLTELTDNRDVRQGLAVPLPIDTQQVVIRDEEVAIGRESIYRINTRVIHPTSLLVSLDLILPPATWTSGYLWISDPIRPGTAKFFSPQSFSAVTRPGSQGKFRAIGRADAIITQGTRGLREGNYTIVTHSRQEREDHLDLVSNSDIILLRIPPDIADPMIADSEGETIYVRTEGDMPETRPLLNRTPHRTIQQGWTEQQRPLYNLVFGGS